MRVLASPPSPPSLSVLSFTLLGSWGRVWPFWHRITDSILTNVVVAAAAVPRSQSNRDELLGKASDKIVFNALKLHGAYSEQKNFKEKRNTQSEIHLRHFKRRALSARGQAVEDKIRNLYGHGSHDIFHEVSIRAKYIVLNHFERYINRGAR